MLQEFYGDFIAVNPHLFSLNLQGVSRVGVMGYGSPVVCLIFNNMEKSICTTQKKLNFTV